MSRDVSSKKGCEETRRPAHKVPGRSGRRRAIALASVHLLIGLHLLHWTITGTTLSPLEPSESMYTLENGQVNAGFIFFIVAILTTALLGRWFCGWACHMVALQDLCGWMMKKIGIKPRPFRSRLLGWVPFLLSFYMFLWPTLKRWAIPTLGLDTWLNPPLPWPGFSDHLMVQDFWATFPSWVIAIPFLLICGFATVYLLGAKAFCSYGCPYGAIFSVADRVAVKRIVANMDACESCGLCTANCTSNVQISREIRQYSMVVDSGCMKCLDCVDICPNGVLSYGTGVRDVARNTAPSRSRSDLSTRAELLLAAIFIGCWFAWRGTFQTPMLMATGISICLTFLLWKCFQLFRNRDVSLHGKPLRRAGSSTFGAKLLMVGTAICLLLTVLAATDRYNRQMADHYFVAAEINLDEVLIPGRAAVPMEKQEAAAEAVRYLEHNLSLQRGGYSLLEPVGTILEERLGFMSAVAGDLDAARRWWSLALVESESDDLLTRFGQLVELQQGPRELGLWLDAQRKQRGNRASLIALRSDLARRMALAALQLDPPQPEAAARHLQQLIGWIGEDRELLLNIAALLEQAGIDDEAQIFRNRLRELESQQR